MAQQLPTISAVSLLSLVSLVSLVLTPSAAMIGGTSAPKTYPAEYLSAIFVYNRATRERTIMCSASLISPYKALTSCYCANYAMLTAESLQQPFNFPGEVYFAVGMNSIEPKSFRAQTKSGKVYAKKLNFSDIYCPPNVNLYDTTNFPADIGIIDVGDVNITKYNLKPVHLAVDTPPSGSKDTYIVAWSSVTSCEDNVGVDRNVGQTTIVDCGQTQLPLSECNADALCSKYPTGIQLSLGDTGSAQVTNGTSHPFDVQFAVTGRQRKTKPYGNGCTVKGEAQINTMLMPYIDWIRQVDPAANFVSISSI